MSSLTPQQRDFIRTQLRTHLLPDTLDIQAVLSAPTATGTTPSYTTATAAVPCRLDPAKTVERITNGITVTQTEYPIWFAVGTAPTRLQALLAPDGTRYSVITLAPVTEWTGLVEVRAARIGGTNG